MTSNSIETLTHKLRKLIAPLDAEEQEYMRRLCRPHLQLPTRVEQLEAMISAVQLCLDCKDACDSGNSGVYWANSDAHWANSDAYWA